MLRDEQRKERRQRILDVAEALVRETNGTSFTMVQLAKRARMSAPTPYNLFGSKGAILYSLLNRAMDDLLSSGAQLRGKAPASLGPVLAMENAANYFIGDPELFRPLYKYQLGEYAREQRPAYMTRALDYWRHSLSGLIDEGCFATGVPLSAEDVAVALLSHSIGVLDLWVQHEFTDREFRARMMQGGACIVYPATAGAARQQLDDALERMQRDIEPGFSFVAQPVNGSR
jgi:AcrR family transcriptional regulator